MYYSVVWLKIQDRRELRLHHFKRHQWRQMNQSVLSLPQTQKRFPLQQMFKKRFLVRKRKTRWRRIRNTKLAQIKKALANVPPAKHRQQRSRTIQQIWRKVVVKSKSKLVPNPNITGKNKQHHPLQHHNTFLKIKEFKMKVVCLWVFSNVSS